jgi:leader peptidase (prepilin peptidase) / N-methyltransferase
MLASMAFPTPALAGASPWELAALAWLALLGIPLAVIDMRSRRLPDRLTIPAFAGVIALLGAGAVADHELGHFGQAIGGAAALAGFYLALMVIRPGGMGLGDVKLAASVGAALAWAGWQALLAGTFLAFVLAAVCGLVLMAMGRATRGGQLPFGPFLLIGALAAIIVV